MKMLRIFFLVYVCFLFTTTASASCDFNHGEVISKLHSPSSIENIVITVPKSAKWAKNALKIAKSPTHKKNIPPELRKSFKANFRINYTFGSCEFEGKIKQNGDLRDHIQLKQGKIIRSLNAKLSNGNILNSVHFKLFLPETRGGLKEIFGVSVLNALGFITPETFQVKVSINGVDSNMIFQETARKEQLERNGRREGPIFEGDESLLWGPSETYFGGVSLSRLENKSWFLKGANSQTITIRAFNALQAAYILNRNNTAKMGLYTDPNLLLPNQVASNLTFPKYHFSSQALGAEHGLTGHNRKYYFNVFENSFEPIYYDGDVFGHNNHEYSIVNMPFDLNILKNSYSNLDVKQYGSFILKEQIKLSAKKKFIERSGISEIQSVEVFEKYWKIYSLRSKNLQKKIQEMHSLGEIKIKKPISLNFSTELDRFLARTSEHPINSEWAIGLQKLTDETYSLELEDHRTQIISAKQLADILSENKLEKSRVTLLTTNTNLETENLFLHKFQSGEIIANSNIKLFIDDKNNKISIKQRHPKDWILFRNVFLEDWTINFIGVYQNPQSSEEQRFNEFGMTGCLNFYNSTFKNVDLLAHSGGCEDSLNIVKSNGSITSIKVSNSFSDAVDIDFSDIIINVLEASSAGNDCLDVSGGTYQISRVKLNICVDKGISVGESSKLNASKVDLFSANIGVSAKDHSRVNISKVEFANVRVCAEAKQKKQEFGGAFLVIDHINCDGVIEVGDLSFYKAGPK